MSGLRPSFLAFLNGLKTALEALRLNQVEGFETEIDAVTAFAAVRIYAHEGISAAIADTRTYGDRLAFIVPTERRFENALEGRTLKSRQHVGCVLLLADRVYGNRPAATTGNDKTPGIIALSEMVASQLSGVDLGLSGVCLLPGDGQPFTLSKDDQDDLPGREVWAQEFSTPAGVLTVGLARAGTVRPVS